MSYIKDEVKSIKAAIRNLEQNEIKSDKSLNKISYLKGLNDAQKLAAVQEDGNYLVIAGPGAGKTHTLVFRVIHLIKCGVPGREICIVTFTRKAASELKERIQSIIPSIELGFIGTIHSLAFTLVNRGLSSVPRIIDPADDIMLIKLVIGEGNYNLPERIQTRTIQKIFDYHTLTLKSLKQTLVDLNREEINVKEFEKLYNAYIEYKKQNGYINYSDCISIAHGLDRGFLKYLIVDEFQDTDPLQLNMLKSLEFPNVMAIGDDFQSIYSFRGADNTIILRFSDHFKDAKVIKLNMNYRSSEEIVELENKITNASDFGYKKHLVSKKGRLNKPVQCLTFDSGSVDKILKRIQKKHNNKTIAIIYRYNRRKSGIEKELIQKKIDYVVYGGIRLLERKHIKDIFAIMLTNKDKNDFIAYLRSLTLLDGIGEVTAKRLMENNMNSNKHEVLKLREILFHEYEDIDKLASDIFDFYLTLESVLKKSNYPIEEIKEDFELIKDISSNYTSISNFIADIILDSSLDKWSNEQKRANVVLTTIHSSKGLEFDEVHFLYDPDNVYDVGKLEENRRLFYTAISRAKEDLFIYDAYGRTNINQVLRDFESDFYSAKNYHDFDYKVNKDTIDTESKSISQTKKLNSKRKKTSSILRLIKDIFKL